MFDLITTNNITEVCQTESCQHVAKTIKNNIDFNIDPCIDFYQYSCGSWIEHTELPPDRAQTSPLSDISLSHQQTLHDLLEGSYDDLINKVVTDDQLLLDDEDIDRENFDKVKQYYDACMDEDTLVNLGPTPIYPFLARQAQQTDLTDIIVSLLMDQDAPLFDIGVAPDDKHPTKHIMVVNQLVLNAPSKDYYEQTDLMDKYRQGLSKVVDAVIGTNQSDITRKTATQKNLTLLTYSDIEQAVQHSVDMEITLARMTVPIEEVRDPIRSYNSMDFSDFEDKYSFVDWKKLIRKLAPKDTNLPDTIIVTTPSYFDKVAEWFEKTPDATDILKNYFMVRYIYSRSSQLDPTTAGYVYDIDSGLFSGVTTKPPRWRHCVASTSLSFGDMLGRYFILVQFGGEDKRKDILTFLDTIHEAWGKRLSSLTWLDKQTLDKALEKLGKIRHKAAYSIHYPDLRSASSLATFYKDMTVNRKTYYDNVGRSNVWGIRQQWKKWGKPVDKDIFDMDAMEANAYYTPNDNEIVVPAGILTSPYYDDQVPDALNFGGIGMVVGHEITHAFDNSGQLYDGDGKLENWWTNATMEKFNEMKTCFIDQYSEFTEKDAGGKVYHVNGKLTLGENLADNGGVGVSYDAFMTLSKTKKQLSLPGLDFSPEQLLYVNYAQSWCTKATPQSRISAILSDEHSPERARINGVVQNSEAFSKLFNCPIGSPMNPTKKCSIW
ncbi:uncharacterized protein BX664DRAFT_336426 [Halteromyces radiatus]|uniref:uncharacterized protein n=1 Tax=Halteromyces radiatus TaxID=101107 RepID=UPI00222065C0|nr:uncharacterized protein BX664DRAFT_336426 [Halteromyces radiatus]KAI8086657.1 hypothetical protein BX664DRAFT_336426 [Halteromyces radiatus]